MLQSGDEIIVTHLDHDGNYYALAVTERLGVEDSGGMVRVGLAHYNTKEEIDRLIATLKNM